MTPKEKRPGKGAIPIRRRNSTTKPSSDVGITAIAFCKAMLAAQQQLAVGGRI